MFYNRAEGRVRAFWRLVVQAALMVGLAALPILLVAEPLTALHRRGVFLGGLAKQPYDRAINMIVGPLLTIAVIASVVIAGRWIDRRDVRRFGWPGRWTDFAKGIAIGGGVMALVFGGEWAVGWVSVTGLAIPLAFTFVKVLCVGTYEEVLSRGYHLVNIAEGASVGFAIFASSAVFALLHLTNDNATAMSVLGLFVNALLFAVARIVSGSLAMPIGLHMGWNLFEGAVFGFPVSGDKEGASLIAMRQLGPDLVTGGAFGPEAGLVGIAASLIGVVLVVVWRQRR